jgi:hypothetical protein
VDETYVRIAGGWHYLYRVVDQHGQVIDVLVSPRRNAAAARALFSRALRCGPTPVEVTTDKASVYPRVIEDVMPAARHVTEQYANNPIEADHGRLKCRLGRCAACTGHAQCRPSPPVTRSYGTCAAPTTSRPSTTLRTTESVVATGLGLAALSGIPSGHRAQTWWANAPLDKRRAVVRTLIESVPIAPARAVTNKFDPARVGEPAWRI